MRNSGEYLVIFNQFNKMGKHIAEIIKAGYRVLVIHGNGPQVGFMLRRSKIAYEGTIQCGFCTPGFVMATTSFAKKCKERDVTEDEIQKAHAGNLCRCTGCQNILKAIEKSIKS